MKIRNKIRSKVGMSTIFFLAALFFSSISALAEKDGYAQNEILFFNFAAVFIITFGLITLVAGLFTAYFGAGKSRAIGGVLTVLGLVVFILSVWLAMENTTGPLGIINWGPVAIFEAFITILGAVIGALIAVVLFLVAIMKS